MLPSRKTVYKLLLILVVLGVAPAVGLVLSRDSNRAARISAPNGVVGQPLVAASAQPARTVRTEFAGVLLPPRMANIAPHADGRVESVLVKVGHAVRKGDIILRFDARQRKHELAQAQAALRGAQASAGAASSEWIAARHRASRRTATVEVNGKAIPIVSGEEAAQAQFDARTASAKAGSAGASIAEAQAHVQALTIALEEADVRAPFDGVVTAILFEPGVSVPANEPVARVVGGSGLRVRFAVAEEDAEVLRELRRARVLLETTVLFASIDQVAPEVEPASRTFFVEGMIEGGEAACGRTGCAMVAGRAVRVAVGEQAPANMAAPSAEPKATAPVVALAH
jgi:RND family efflux transporter MFP subunit